MVWPLSEPEPVPDPAAERAAANKKKWIIAGVVLALLLIVVLIIVLCLIFLLPEQEEDIGEQLKKNMNMSVDPCHDFYNYACGGWIQAHKNSEVEMSTFTILEETTRQRLLGLLEAPIEAGEASYKTKMKRFFTSCTNEERRKERGAAPFLTFLKKFGPFPIMEPSFDSTNVNMQNLLTRLTLTMANPFFTIEYKSKNDLHIIHIEPSEDKLVSSDDEARGILRRLGVKTDTSDFESQIQGMFSIKANVSQLSYASLKHGTFMSIQNLQHQYNWLRFNWLQFIQNVTGTANFNSETTVYVARPDFLDNVTSLYFTEEYSRDLVNYLMKNLLFFTYILDTSFIPQEKIAVSRKDKLSKCLMEDGNIFQLAASCMYVDEYYTHDYSQNIADMMGELKEAYRQSIHEAYLEPYKEEKLNLISSINQVKEKVGLIGSLKDGKHINYLNSFFEKITSDEYFEMIIELMESAIPLHFQSIQGGLTLSFQESRFIYHSSLDVFAYYIPEINYIAVPAASLQSPLINPKWPSSVNYGAMGSLLSREILLAMIVSSRSSWLNQTRAINHMNCVFESFIQRSLDRQQPRNLDKTTTFQLFLDVQGVQASFMAYQNFQKSRGEEPLIKGLDMNHNQLFFLGYTQMMCQVIPAIKMLSYFNGETSTNAMRALISLLTSKDFAEAYKCDAGTPMNSISKCNLFWKNQE